MSGAGGTHEIERKFILDTREFFSNIDVWPQSPRYVDPKGWLSNFHGEDDLDIATHLLDSFLLVKSEQVNKMIRSAFHSLSPYVADMFASSPTLYAEQWNHFRSTLSLTFPSERQDPGGSGHLFARLSREFVDDEATQIKDPSELVRELAGTTRPRPVVFVDDFAGTGNQFCATWHRKYNEAKDMPRSFHELAAAGQISQAYFIPAICTARAKSQIARLAPSVKVRAAHLIPPRYSATDPHTSLVPPRLRGELDTFLRRHASAAGYSEELRFGYEDSGLALSFEHSTPDNTLPIFNGGKDRPTAWRPLRRMS